MAKCYRIDIATLKRILNEKLYAPDPSSCPTLQIRTNGLSDCSRQLELHPLDVIAFYLKKAGEHLAALTGQRFDHPAINGVGVLLHVKA